MVDRERPGDHTGRAPTHIIATVNKVVKPAYVTLLHNGVLVQDHTEVKGSTHFDRPHVYERHPEKGPLVLMYHGNPVQFRNIWIREIKDLDHKMPEKKDS